MACWGVIGQALDRGEISPEALSSLCGLKCVPDTRGILSPPDWMFFENRAGLAEKFGAFLANNVITRPIGIGSALAAAGVRSLGTAVKLEVLECVNPADDDELRERVAARKNQIGRVLEAYGVRDTSAALRRLEDMRFQSASSIEISYRLRAFNQERKSTPETVPAVFEPDQQTIIFCARVGAGGIPWPAISRELAIGLFPEEEPGRLAAGFKEALAADSAAEAAAILDELGFARLDTSIVEPTLAGDGIDVLGVDTVLETDASATDPCIGQDDIKPEDTAKPFPGCDALSPSVPGGLIEIERLVSDEGASTEKRVEQRRQRAGRPVLRSYLPAPKIVDDAWADDRDDQADKRSSVEQAGIRHVMDYEHSVGRNPKEMPPNNPGYDIESSEEAGAVIRYIEVKSFSGRWSSTYAVLSRPQFEKAYELGDRFWLYVVERAESEDFLIHRIQAPATKANRFMFDDGWSATSEALLVYQVS